MINVTLVDLLQNKVNERPGHPAVVEGARTLTYGDLASEAKRLADWLLANGLDRRQRVGICLPKSLEEVVAILGVSAARGVFVNINYQWTLEQLAYVAEDCEITVLITDTRRARQILNTQEAERFQHLLVVGEAPEHPKVTAWGQHGIAGPAERASNGAPIGADLAALLYTSGSTGRPKGVMITQAQLVRGAEIVTSYIGNQADDRVLSLPPFSFDYGLNQLTSMLLVGGTLVLQRVPMPAEIIKTVVEQQVTGLPLVAPTWVQVVRYLKEEPTALPDLRYLTNTGGKIPGGILEAMPEVFPGVRLFLMYGLTEAFRSTYLPPEQFQAKRGAIGQAIPNVEIFVVNAETGLCSANEVGELIHRGDLISLGYWGKPDATEERIRVNPHLRSILGEEKVVHSGDLGYLDEDGVLWYVGRDDAMIKSTGFRISPTEVEEVVYLYDGIEDAVAFGVEDDDLGQAVHVAVTAAGALEAAALIKYCRAKMPHYMVPRRIHLMDRTMPRTPSGKIDRQEVVNLCLQSIEQQR